MITNTFMQLMAFVLALTFIGVCLSIYYNSTRARDTKEIKKQLEKLIKISMDEEIKKRTENEWNES